MLAARGARWVRFVSARVVRLGLGPLVAAVALVAAGGSIAGSARTFADGKPAAGLSVGSGGQGLWRLPTAAQAAVSSRLGAQSSAFFAHRSGGGYRLGGGGVTARLSSSGISLGGEGVSLSMTVAGL